MFDVIDISSPQVDLILIIELESPRVEFIIQNCSYRGFGYKEHDKCNLDVVQSCSLPLISNFILFCVVVYSASSYAVHTPS